MNAEAFVGPQADFSADGRWTGVLMEYTLRDILAERGQKVRIDETGKREVVGSVGDSTELLKLVKPERSLDLEALDRWNDYTVITNKGHTVLNINGVVMCEIEDNDPKRVPSGRLALQVHQGPPMLVQFKDIRLRQF